MEWPSNEITQESRRAEAGNLKDYGTQFAAAENFVVRLAAHSEAARSLAMQRLTPKQEASSLFDLLDAQRRNIEIVSLAIPSVMRDLNPADARLVSKAIRDTGPVWAGSFPAGDRKSMLILLARACAEVQDAQARDDLTAFAAMLAPGG